MWLWCNVSTVMRMGLGQGRNLGCRSSLRPARGGMERCACNTRGQSVGDHADRGSDKTAAARVLLSEMLMPPGGPRRGCVRRAARNRPG